MLNSEINILHYRKIKLRSLLPFLRENPMRCLRSERDGQSPGEGDSEALLQADRTK
ncbi:hypothetical protein [Nodularia sphaerocarpa]|uniref:hypothetical protein n=1 Tax=Nodularia sphaerocarpa TaxID=137816 RepID=UPI00232FC43B|nr:hypothetical protein [Nodularia sphaerocarpa]MDB9372328.1 hypothetical protein [Nodularia sphaerocarpa CS-585]MDB9377944.1 hypothetical protein [Nodularia sphaerocarpa CS-585A2]